MGTSESSYEEALQLDSTCRLTLNIEHYLLVTRTKSNSNHITWKMSFVITHRTIDDTFLWFNFFCIYIMSNKIIAQLILRLSIVTITNKNVTCCAKHRCITAIFCSVCDHIFSYANQGTRLLRSCFIYDVYIQFILHVSLLSWEIVTMIFFHVINRVVNAMEPLSYIDLSTKCFSTISYLVVDWIPETRVAKLIFFR